MSGLDSAAWLLVAAVAAVGVLHTIVPDHWAPITLLARQQGWSLGRTARTAAIAGAGHAVSTLVIAVIVWTIGVPFARSLGNALSTISSVALIAFGMWIAVGAWREIQGGDHDHAHDYGHSHFGHAHVHRHEGGMEHRHWHEHHSEDWHAVDGTLALAPPVHAHDHKTSSRTALLLILGSSPMVEGIPAFFAAARFGPWLLAIMSVVFAVTTIATYVVLCTTSVARLQRVDFGPVERYGEVLSGGFIAAMGLVFLVFPVL